VNVELPRQCHFCLECKAVIPGALVSSSSLLIQGSTAIMAAGGFPIYPRFGCDNSLSGL
jgi:hypothetical protein